MHCVRAITAGSYLVSLYEQHLKDNLFWKLSPTHNISSHVNKFWWSYFLISLKTFPVFPQTLGGSDDDSCVITASLHIPAAFSRGGGRRGPRSTPRRRSTSGSESSNKSSNRSSNKRDSAVGSSSPASASATSSPPASPPPATPAPAPTPLRVTLTSAAELRRPSPDLDRLMALSRSVLYFNVYCSYQDRQ